MPSRISAEIAQLARLARDGGLDLSQVSLRVKADLLMSTPTPAPDDLAAFGEMAAALATAGDAFQLQSGKMVVELRPASGDKGTAVAAFLAQPAFQGRLPIAIGDDLTDEAMFRLVAERGGRGIRIGQTLEASAATERLPSPAALRALLAEIAP